MKIGCAKSVLIQITGIPELGFRELKPGQVMPVRIWEKPIALYRSQDGQVHAIEDACPHKGIALHKGKVAGENLTCPYHGWEFNGDGVCTNIPYFPKDQKLPCAKARSYTVREKYNIVWIFPERLKIQKQSNFLQFQNMMTQTGWLFPYRESLKLISPSVTKTRWTCSTAICIKTCRAGSIQSL